MGRRVEQEQSITRAAPLTKLVFRFRGDTRGVAKEFHKAVAFGFSRALLEKVSSRFNDTNFLRHGRSNPLVQGHAVLFREALGGFLDGVRKFQWISSSTHGFILFKTSIGRKTDFGKAGAAALRFSGCGFYSQLPLRIPLETNHLNYFRFTLDLFLLCDTLCSGRWGERARTMIMNGHHGTSQNLRGALLDRLRNSCNSLQITSLADPRSLTPIESHPYQKQRGGGYLPIYPEPRRASSSHPVPAELSGTLPSLSFQHVTRITFCNSFSLITIQIARGVRTPFLFAATTIANLHLYFQPLPGCSSRNSFAFNFLHRCPGVGGSPLSFTSSSTLSPVPLCPASPDPVGAWGIPRFSTNRPSLRCFEWTQITTHFRWLFLNCKRPTVNGQRPIATLEHESRNHQLAQSVREGSLATSLSLELEDALQELPLFAGLGVRQRLLELPHQLLPLANFGIRGVGFGFRCKREFVVHFHDHEHARAEQINLHVLDARVADALADFGPDFLMIAPVFGDELRIVFQVQREAAAFGHFVSGPRWSSFKSRPRQQLCSRRAPALVCTQLRRSTRRRRSRAAEPRRRAGYSRDRRFCP